MNKFTYIHDIHNINETKQSHKSFLQSVQELFRKSLPLQEDEIFYVFKATLNAKNRTDAHGFYFGTDMSPLSFITTHNEHDDEPLLAEALSIDVIIEFLESTTKSENLYAFKASFLDFKLHRIESLYGGQHDISLNIFKYTQDEEDNPSLVLKRLGKDKYKKLFDFDEA